MKLSGFKKCGKMTLYFIYLYTNDKFTSPSDQPICVFKRDQILNPYKNFFVELETVKA